MTFHALIAPVRIPASMLLDEAVYIKLLRQQICLKQSEEITAVTVSQIELPTPIGGDDQINVVENNESIKAGKDLADTLGYAKDVKDPTSEKVVACETSASLDASGCYRFQLDIESKADSEGHELVRRPLFRMYIPARVLKRAKQVLENDTRISIDAAIRDACSHFRYHLRERQTEGQYQTTVKRSRRRSDSASKRRERPDCEPENVRIDRVNGYLNHVLARRPSWCDKIEEEDVKTQQTMNSAIEVSVPRLHPKKCTRKSPT